MEKIANLTFFFHFFYEKNTNLCNKINKYFVYFDRQTSHVISTFIRDNSIHTPNSVTLS